MNNSDREYLEGKFTAIHEKLDTQGKQLACIEERWKMTWKFAGFVGGTIALITTIVVKILWR
jgi:hypothetical protein